MQIYSPLPDTIQPVLIRTLIRDLLDRAVGGNLRNSFDVIKNIPNGVYLCSFYSNYPSDEWVDFKIEVKGEHASLYLYNSKYPVLVVNDLRHGADVKGGIGLYFIILNN